MNWYIDVLKKYAVFGGRARRKEFWIFFLINFILDIIIGFLEGLAGSPGFVSVIYNLAVFIPSIAVGVRRMHDTDRSGWWVLLPVVNIVFLCLDSQAGDNRFGANPKSN